MVQEEKKLAGPDLTQGIALDELPDGGMLVGHDGDEQILLVRRGSEVFAVGAQCTHYQGPLAEGLVVGDTVRCPWHHACFDLRTGEALRAPALSPIACWNVEQRDGKIAVREKRKQPIPKPRGKAAFSEPEKIVIIGGGAAGFAAAEMLRRSGYQNSIVMLSSDNALPYDRPNLSKDYLAGTIPFDYVPLRDDRFYADNSIDTRMGQAAVQVDIRAREVIVAGGGKISYDRLLLATGAEPVRLTIPGADQPHVRTLRSLADCQAIIERAKAARRVVVIGASFIGLEVAAALRARNLEVHVVAPDKRPMERILGPDMGNFVRALHEEHGVDLSPRRQSRCHRRKGRPLGERWHDRGRSGGCRHRRSTTSGACRESRPEARPRGRRRPVSRDECPGRLRGRRYSSMARPTFRRKYPRRALGRRRASRTSRGSQHAGPRHALHRRAVFLEPALRCPNQLCGSCGGMGRDRD